MPSVLLTDKLLEKVDPVQGLNGIPAPNGRLELWDEYLEGFGYRATKKGKGSFFIMYRIGAERRRTTIGRYPVLSLALARKEATDVLHAVRHGKDPEELKAAADAEAAAAVKAAADADAAAAERRFDKIAELFVLQYCRGIDKKTGQPNEVPNLKSWKEVKRYLDKNVVPIWGEKDIAAIKRNDVARLMKSIATNNGPITANRTLAAIRKLFNWALVQPELMEVLEANPVIPGMAPGKEKERDRFLSAAEIGIAWPILREIGYPWGTHALMLLTTLQRRGEVAKMRRGTINKVDRIWTLEKRSTKADRRHEVMLSDLALQLLSEIETEQAKALAKANAVREDIRAALAAPDRKSILAIATDLHVGLDAVRRVRDEVAQGVFGKPDTLGPFLFSTDGGKSPISGFTFAKNLIDEKIEAALDELRAKDPELADEVFQEDWHIHDLRRTGATVLEDDLGVQKAMIGAILNHAEGGATGIYTKGQLRKRKLAAMQALSRYLKKLGTGEQSNNVVQLRA